MPTSLLSRPSGRLLVATAWLAACSGASALGSSPGPGATAAAPPVDGGAITDGPTSGTPPPADAGTEARPDAGPPAVQYIGRFDTRDPAGPKCGWPGCRIVARFVGPSVSVRLHEDTFDIGPSEWDVAIDGAWRTPHLVLAQGTRTYGLASGLAPGEHQVELYKRTEAQCGVTQFLGFEFTGGSLLPPPPRASRRVEIIGDSDVTGFGYVGSITGVCVPDPVWAARFENFRGAWGARLGVLLTAEVQGTAFSGKGFYYNIWRPDTETIGVLYPRADPLDPTSLWDFTRFVPDVVIIAIGGNDFNEGLPTDNGPAPIAGFTQKARELTATVRAQYMRTHIFLMAYAALSDTWPPGRGRRTNVENALRAIRDERVAGGDALVYFTAPPEYDPAELTGCGGHGGPAYHARIAAFLASDVRARTGWN